MTIVRNEANMTIVRNEAEQDLGAKERLLAAALALFNQKGYAATSVREMVSEAGVTKPVLYYYFGNKEGIFRELMEQSFTTFESLAAGIVSSEGSAPERIIRFCSDLLDVSLERLPLLRLIYAIYYGPPQGAPYVDLDAYFLRLLEVIRGLVREGIATGELRESDVEDVSRTIVAILTSTISEQLCRRESRMDREGLIRMLRLLMCGIAGG